MAKMYIKKCKYCGRKIETIAPNRTVCDECKKPVFQQRQQAYQEENYKVVPKRRRVSTYNVMPVRKFVILLDRYNEKHGTRYTYGQAMQCLADGTIEEKEFYSSEE